MASQYTFNGVSLDDPGGGAVSWGGWVVPVQY